MIRVVLVDDHVMVREGCRRVLEEARGIEVVGQAGSAEEALSMVRALQPDVVLMDIHLPGASGLQATEHLTATQPDSRVIVLSMVDRLPMPQRLLAAGAWGYLTKDGAAEELVRAVRSVAQGRRHLSAEIASQLAMTTANGGMTSALDALTSRETEVAMRLARGESNKEIAQHLRISVKTISTHKTRILEKLGVTNIVALSNLLAHHQMLEPSAGGHALSLD